mgnify:CR=1 FL=1
MAKKATAKAASGTGKKVHTRKSSSSGGGLPAVSRGIAEALLTT